MTAAPPLLVSLHDVSPLTLEACRAALALFDAAGLPRRALSCFVIPDHEGQARLDRHPETVRFLRRLEDEGATLVMHGLTHRMPGRVRGFTGWLWGRWFARGQGELWSCNEDETRRRLAAGREILTAAGLESATHGFIPPAWLLSPGARRAVEAAGFTFYEVMGGIVAGAHLRARRLVGWGSLTALEAAATSLHASWQARRRPADTRFAVHPADMRRALSVASVRAALARLLPRTTPLNYASYLALPSR